MPVRLHRLTNVPPPTARAVRDALAAAMAQLGVPRDAEVAFVLTDDVALRDLNRVHRGIDAPTDVLSFPDTPDFAVPGEPPYLGDIIISVPFAAREAAERRHSLLAELELLAVHGLLHLLGHEDETDAGAEAMARLEVALGVREPEPD